MQSSSRAVRARHPVLGAPTHTDFEFDFPVERGRVRTAAADRPRRPARSTSKPPHPHRPSRSASAGARRIATLTALLVLAVTFLQFTASMSARSNVPFSIRAVEWLRDNGAAGLVSEIERLYYSLNAPATGGPALRKLPGVGVAGTGAAGSYQPSQIAPEITPALPGEGVWQGTGITVGGASPVLVTTFRPDPLYPELVAGVAWIDSTRSWIQLYPGAYEPPNAGGAAAVIPPILRSGLLAAFNSGFKLEDDSGGFVAFGRVYAPLRDGQATFVRYRNGTADVLTWNGGATPPSNVEFARQNLPLIVDGGQLNPNLADGPQWGATLGNAIRVWRSGVGVDARGNIIYAAADAQTAASLASILQRAGAVRAMELDINYEWVTFDYFGATGAAQPHKLLPGMSRDPARYLTPDDRDFFAVYARNGS